MTLLTDTDLRIAVGEPHSPTLILGIENQDKQIRGCSVDLTIGKIFRPGIDGQKVGSVSQPREYYSLIEGETAVIQTSETFKLDARHAAFVFPASHVSLNGLLMTNPGHVDPGYEGNLHVTVINMGREPYSLKKGDRFLRAFVFDLEKQAATVYDNSRPSPINEELLDRLSPDFLSVTNRTQAAVRKEISRTEVTARIWQIFITVFFTVFGSAATLYISNNSLSKEFAQRIDQLDKIKIETRLLTLENNW